MRRNVIWTVTVRKTNNRKHHYAYRDRQPTTGHLLLLCLLANKDQREKEIIFLLQNLNKHLKCQLFLVISVRVHTIICTLFFVAFHDSLPESMNNSVVWFEKSMCICLRKMKNRIGLWCSTFTILRDGCRAALQEFMNTACWPGYWNVYCMAILS